jgi:hypothetical protein
MRRPEETPGKHFHAKTKRFDWNVWVVRDRLRKESAETGRVCDKITRKCKRERNSRDSREDKSQGSEWNAMGAMSILIACVNVILNSITSPIVRVLLLIPPAPTGAKRRGCRCCRKWRGTPTLRPCCYHWPTSQPAGGWWPLATAMLRAHTVLRNWKWNSNTVNILAANL